MVEKIMRKNTRHFKESVSWSILFNNTVYIHVVPSIRLHTKDQRRRNIYCRLIQRAGVLP